MIWQDLKKSIVENRYEYHTEDTPINSITKKSHDNVIKSDTFKRIQIDTLKKLSEYLSMTYGPMGSYTSIITGSNLDPNDSDIVAHYSKDGLFVLKHIIFDMPIEVSLQSQIRDICSYVEKTVGDGTTSAVILSTFIYTELVAYMQQNSILPRKLIQIFKAVIMQLQEDIRKHKRDITLSDIYDICMISTNGNEQVSNDIKELYEKFGFDVDISVSISNDANTKIKEYDGLTINTGYSDPVFINNKANMTSEIHNARVYGFIDPVDTPEMVSLLEKIIYDNIIIHLTNNDPNGVVPTVIIAPMISRDGSSLLIKLMEMLHKYNQSDLYNQKPPFVLLTNLSGVDELIAEDIMTLCSCKPIKKYINEEIQEADIEKGEAPTLDTIADNFYGECELVVTDSDKAKFINPKGIMDDSQQLEMLMDYIESQIKHLTEINEDRLMIERYRKRLRSLKQNMVEYLVGGISISDRDALKDLIEDATKNCKSAAEYGVGYAANFEGLRAAIEYYIEHDNTPKIDEKDYEITTEIIGIVIRSYYNAIKLLYSTVLSDNKEIEKYIDASIKEGKPFNITEIFNGEIKNMIPNGNVLSSIETDATVLEAISKIVTIMATSNQCIVQTPAINVY